MTDKQIIIDGCDVQNCVFLKYCDTDVEFSECLAHWHPNEDYSNVYYAQCDAYPNCYYKQLLRKEQECEELKEEIKKHNDDMFKNPPEKRFYCKGCTLPYISKKLQQTLTEIKKIMKKHCRKCKKNKFYYFQLCCTCKYTDILQKISEVLE